MSHCKKNTFFLIFGSFFLSLSDESFVILHLNQMKYLKHILNSDKIWFKRRNRHVEKSKFLAILEVIIFEKLPKLLRKS